MAEHNMDTAEIYDNPAQHMTFAGIFWYVGIDLIPMRTNATGTDRYEHQDNDLHEMRRVG